jgi:hypothetical protein
MRMRRRRQQFYPTTKRVFLHTITLSKVEAPRLRTKHPPTAVAQLEVIL